MNCHKANILIEALPYIRKFRGKTFVIKYGGSIIKNKESQKSLIEDMALLMLVGIRLVIVHGGGPSISEMLNRLDIQTEFVRGLRVTDKNIMEVVEMVLSGQVNKDITSELCKHGIKAIGISGRDGQLIKAQKKYLIDNDKEIDIGYVGKVESVNKDLLKELIDKEYLPIVSPVGCDDKGNSYNINADYVASAISSALEVEKLILISDVKGLYKDVNDESSLISKVCIDEINNYIEKDIISGGMLPKMECCINAITNGTKNVHLISGKNEHNLLLEIFTDKGIGTMVEGGIINVKE